MITPVSSGRPPGITSLFAANTASILRKIAAKLWIAGKERVGV
jgi:hypothetical protein